MYLLAVDPLLPNLDFRRNSEELETLKWRTWFMIFKMTEHTCLQASQSIHILSTWIGRDWSSMKLINTDFILKGYHLPSGTCDPKAKKKKIKSYCIGWSQGLDAHVSCKELWRGVNFFLVNPREPFFLMLCNLALDRWDSAFCQQPLTILKSIKMCFCLLRQHRIILLFNLLFSGVVCGLHF